MKKRKTSSKRPRRVRTRYNSKFIFPEEGTIYHDLMQNTKPEVIVSGPYESGKTMPCLMKLHRECSHNKINALIVRKKKESLRASVCVSYEQKILPFNPRLKGSRVRVHGGQSPRWYDYLDTGSRITLGGLSKPEDFLSGEFDLIYVNQVEEINERDWILLMGRCTGRAGNLPYGMIYGDCNPGSNKHWILKRKGLGYIEFLDAKHKDNPWLFRNGIWTKQGNTTRSRLQTLTGVDYERGYLGLWVAAEGQVFPFREELHTHELTEADIPADAIKFCSIDFGDTHPFVCLWWWLDQKGILRSFNEIYLTNQLIYDMGDMINAYNKKHNHEIQFYVGDWQKQERRILSEKGIHLKLANKEKIPGINLMKRRFVEETIQYRRKGNLLYQRDKFQFDNGLPWQTIDEFGGYAYKPLNKQRGDDTDDEPMKGSDDGIDASRYGIVAIENYFAYEPILGSSETPASLPEYLLNV